MQAAEVYGDGVSIHQSFLSLKPGNITDCDKLPSIASSTSTLSYERFCRICREKSGDMYSYCQCKGSVALVHSSCLMEWIKKSGLIKCELCKEKYSTITKVNRCFWQWRLPRLGTKGWLKLAFFLGFLSMLITFTTWIIWSRLSSSSQARKERNKRQVEYTYLVYGMLVLIALVGMYALNFRPFLNYVSKCMVINQDITMIPRGELCHEKLYIVGEKPIYQCKHAGRAKETFVQMQNDAGWKRSYLKLQGTGELVVV